MAEDGPEAKSAGADSPEGVFGNLPSARPGSRSPRRRGTDAEKDVAGATPAAPEPDPVTAKPEPDPQPERDMPEGEADPPQPNDDPLAPQPSIHGVEDLAWAGVAVVAQAATAGIRFTSKALEAARKSIDRP
jgi:hypothetical protein